jgi:serine/threonine protein kinase
VKPVIFQPGQQVCGEQGGRFRVLEWVGEGSYARVYRAEGASGVVALKLAKSEVPGAAARLLQERAAHAVLTHPAIPALIDAGHTSAEGAVSDEDVWLVREWVAGHTLAHRVATGRCLPLVQAIPVLHRTADALAAIHGAGWSHGDVRPQNLLLQTGTNLAFLLDLGEAQPSGRPDGRAPKAAPDRRRPLARAIRPRPIPVSHHRPVPDRAGTSSSDGEAAVRHDLQQLGELLVWGLTGADPRFDPERLSLAAGYHPVVVQLWQDTCEGVLSSAAAFRDAMDRLARQLGLFLQRRSG